MESKRKSNGAGDDLDERAAKRRKVPSDSIDTSVPETRETTTKQGLELVEIIKKTMDKNGRVISTSFLTLPNRRQFPSYYDVIKMPIALDTIQEKLERRQFKNLTALESYFKRMISNAKDFNQRGSDIYEDAERLRKALSNWMTRTNPAYKLIPGYTATPTPLPKADGEVASDDEDAEGESDSEAEVAALVPKPRGRPKIQLKTSQSSRKSITPAITTGGRYAGVSFSKLTFQQAQEKILEQLSTEKEHPDDYIGTWEVFLEIPPKSLRDYHHVIKNPTSLMSVQKLVKGGKDGISAFKSWASFEKSMKNIWNNAWIYNEDGSEISEQAIGLEKRFNQLLKEAKQAVPEPVGPKIKLKVSEQPVAPKITLKLSGRGSPTESPAPQSNGSNGTPANGKRRNPFGSSYSAAAPVPSLDQLERARSASNSAPSPTPSNSDPVKNEQAARNSSAVPAAGYNNNYHANSQAVSTPGLPGTGSGMPPPSTPGLPNNNNNSTSISNNHNIHSNNSSTNTTSLYTSSGYAQSFPHQPQYQAQHSAFESKWRQPGKTAADALLTNLNLATHPGLNITRHFKMDLPPSPTMAQQSVTIVLPHTHYYLQIKPTLAQSLLDRQYKLFVTSGSQRLHAMPLMPGHAQDARHPLFEARLLPGVNRIELELIAALPKGASKLGGSQDVELEKITIFANLLKDPQQR